MKRRLTVGVLDTVDVIALEKLSSFSDRTQSYYSLPIVSTAVAPFSNKFAVVGPRSECAGGSDLDSYLLANRAEWKA